MGKFPQGVFKQQSINSIDIKVIVCPKKYIHTIFPFSESIFHHAPNYMYTTLLYLPLEAEMNVLIARDLKSVE